MLISVVIMIKMCKCSFEHSFLNLQSSLKPVHKKDEMIHLHPFEFYPTVGSIGLDIKPTNETQNEHVYVCFEDSLRDYKITCNFLQLSKKKKVFWVVNNTHSNCTLYNTMVSMNYMYHMDGIIVIADENHTNDLFSLYSHESDKTVLRINPEDAEILKKYDISKHFADYIDTLRVELQRSHTREELNDILSHYYLNQTEEESNLLSFSYKGTGNWYRNSEGNEDDSFHLMNVYTALFLFWILMVCRWFYCNRLWFFRYHVYDERTREMYNLQVNFHGGRVLFLFILKGIQYLDLAVLIMIQLFPHERVVYMKNRSSFELTMWTVLCFKHISTGLFLSIIYSLSEETAFSLTHRMDQNKFFNSMHVIMVCILPMINIFGTMFSFLLVYELLYIYFALEMYIFICILINCGRTLWERWNEGRNYIFNLLVTIILCFSIYIPMELSNSYTRAAQPSQKSLKSQCVFEICIEIIISFSVLMCIAFLDKDKIITYYNEQDEDNERHEVREPPLPRVAEHLIVTLPSTDIQYQKSTLNENLLKKSKDPWKRVKFDEEKNAKRKSNSQNSPIFGSYKTNKGWESTKIIDMKEGNQNNTIDSNGSLTQENDTKVPVDMFNDAYKLDKPVLLKRLDSNTLPNIIINPDYFCDRENMKNQRKRQFSEIQLLLGSC
ncbi:unnamed protein product [Moneuplotes crassus]|uniref:Uncharacterized protein n=1 Tax=Euplotes crassus TaxID=5936 RepID=A0AAD1U0P7_EUPCR|nr:unnamed protein product [Moneuplotes crassus]